MLIKIVLFVVIGYFVLVGMVATYLITFAKDEEKRQRAVKISPTEHGERVFRLCVFVTGK